MCRLGSSIDNFDASRALASEQSRSNRTHYLSYRASGRRMRVRISAYPLAGSVGPLALGPLHFKDAQEPFSRKHAQLGSFSGITISMDGKGCGMYNAFVERLWRSLKV